jgi:hypothetical protein
MRVLVAGRNAKILAKAAGTFAADLEIHTAATRAASFALLARVKFDLIVACETLADGSGLEVLSHVAVNTPNTLRVFAARPATLVLLKSELGLFGLFRTLPYPINFPKLWAAINLARSTCVEEAAPPRPRRPQPRRDTKQPASQPAFDTSIRVTATSAAAKPPRQPTAAPRSAKAAQVGAPRPQPQAVDQPEFTSGMRAAARYAAAHSGRAVAPAKAVRIPETDAFKRARARRESGRLEPVVSNESLAQLAKLASTNRPNPAFRATPPGKKRAALFVGSGVFAATTAAVLTFFMVSANDSVKHPKLPVIASITQPVPNKVFPWQPETQQPTRQAAFMRSEAPASAVADMEAEAEAASESQDGDPDHPGPPPPYAPPPPSEPPSEESPGQPVDE